MAGLQTKKKDIPLKERFVIQGLGGKQKLRGNIPVRGAKNAALKAFAAALLFEDTVRLARVPHIEDIASIVSLLKALGVFIKKEDSSSYSLSAPKKITTELSRTLAKRLRASIVLTGPILARFGEVSFPHPGGCVIGARPIDIFLDGFRKMGAEVEERSNGYSIIATDGLRGAEILFKSPSVTATETLMMAAVLASGKTVIKNAACEPEIKTLADFLNECGANIDGAGSPTIVVVGGTLLHAEGKAYQTPPDRIETGSFLILGALAAEDLRITGCDPTQCEALIDLLRLAGVSIESGSNFLHVRRSRGVLALNSFDIKTQPYPGFPTDLQAPMTVFLTQAKGTACVFETIFDGRLEYVPELVRMGADITVCDPHRIIVRGQTPLQARSLLSPDLRAGLAFVIAATVAEGESVIHNVWNIDRGYERIEERLRGIGVDIKRVS